MPCGQRIVTSEERVAPDQPIRSMNASIFSRLAPEEITALHESWKNDPLSVDPLWAAWFEGYELGSGGAPQERGNTGNGTDASP